MRDKILVINPGSTSTKIALFDFNGKLWDRSISHSLRELSKYDTIYDQLDMRYELVASAVEESGGTFGELAAVVSRGGPFARVESGAYRVTETMLEIIRTRPMDQHASNIGAAIAKKIADSQGIEAYIYDAVTVDEMIPLTRVTGLKEMERHGQGHNLNMRAAALAVCARRELDYYASNILVAHLGGGITLSLHHNGRIIDMISDDEGPFAPERSGGVPCFQLIELCYSGKYDKKAMFKHIQRAGGLVAHFGTSDTREVERRVLEGDEQAKLVYEAMALNVAKNLAKLAVVVNGEIDCVVLTGGIAYSKLFTDMVAKRIRFLGPLEIVPGENEMQALYEGALRVLRGEEKAKEYEET